MPWKDSLFADVLELSHDQSITHFSSPKPDYLLLSPTRHFNSAISEVMYSGEFLGLKCKDAAEF